jgi:hypothetical protein
VDAVGLLPHRDRLDRQAQRQPGQVEQVPPAAKGRIVNRDETVRELEQDLKDRYPCAQVSVTGEGDRVTVAVNQPNDSIRLKTDTARIEGGSAVLARMLGRCTDLPRRIFTNGLTEHRNE